MKEDNTLPSSLDEKIVNELWQRAEKHFDDSANWSSWLKKLEPYHRERIIVLMTTFSINESAQQLPSPGTSDAVEFGKYLLKNKDVNWVDLRGFKVTAVEDFNNLFLQSKQKGDNYDPS
jgi:hypothetical protein